jgi:phosphoserine phosphatase
VSISVINLPLPQLERAVIEQQALIKNHQIDITNISLELVVLADITLIQLLDLISYCKISLLAINAINKRNNQQSYRFAVQVNNLNEARSKLAQFAQQHYIEAILIDDAPLLNNAGLLVMDMDSTTIKIECIDEIATLAGVGEQVAAVTEQAMQGQLDFAQSLHQRVATLKDAPSDILDKVAANLPLMDGLTTLINELQQYNWRIAIASGGFTYFSEHLKTILELDDTFANTLEIIDNKLTGNVLGDVVDAQAKANTIKLLQEKYHIKNTQTVAIGDGANDLAMMAKAHLGVAFHAKPIVLAKADTCIHFAGLDLLLHWLK